MEGEGAFDCVRWRLVRVNQGAGLRSGREHRTLCHIEQNLKMDLGSGDPVNVLIIHTTVHGVVADTFKERAKNVVEFGEELGQELESFA